MKSFKNRGGLTAVIILFCMAIILSCVIYLVMWKLKADYTRQTAEEYARIYAQTEIPEEQAYTETPTVTPEPQALITPTVCPTETATVCPTDTIMPVQESTMQVPTAVPMSTIPTSTETPVPEPTQEAIVSMLLPTEPPVSERFRELLEINPETIGYLKLPKIEFPVVKRKNDNNYYLTHNFRGEEDSSGALFMDGFNMLVPEDDCLIVYGHNMRNGTMLAKLRLLEYIYHFQDMGLAAFDTLYEERLYVPFGIFVASIDDTKNDSFDPRRFLFSDSSEFDSFVSEVREHSLFYVDVDIKYGDHLLLVVTCNTASDDQRIVLALRQLREDEDPKDMIEAVSRAKFS